MTDPFAKYRVGAQAVIDSTNDDPLAKYRVNKPVVQDSTPVIPTVSTPAPQVLPVTPQVDPRKENLRKLVDHIATTPDNVADSFVKGTISGIGHTASGVLKTASKIADASPSILPNRINGTVAPLLAGAAGKLEEWLNTTTRPIPQRSGQTLVENKIAKTAGEVYGMLEGGAPIAKGANAATNLAGHALPMVFRNRALAAIKTVAEKTSGVVGSVAGAGIGKVAGTMVERLPQEVVSGTAFTAVTDPESLTTEKGLYNLAAFTVFGNMIASTLHIKQLKNAAAKAQSIEDLDRIAASLEEYKQKVELAPRSEIGEHSSVLLPKEWVALNKAEERYKAAVADATLEFRIQRENFEKARGGVSTAEPGIVQSKPDADKPGKLITPDESGKGEQTAPGANIITPQKSTLSTFGGSSPEPKNLTTRQKFQRLVQLKVATPRELNRLKPNEIDELHASLYANDKQRQSAYPNGITGQGYDDLMGSQNPYNAREKEFVDEYIQRLELAAKAGRDKANLNDLFTLADDITKMADEINTAPAQPRKLGLPDDLLQNKPTPYVTGSDLVTNPVPSGVFSLTESKAVPKKGEIVIAGYKAKTPVPPTIGDETTKGAYDRVKAQIQHPELLTKEKAEGGYMDGLNKFVRAKSNKLMTEVVDRTKPIGLVQDLNNAKWEGGQTPQELAHLSSGNSLRAHEWTHGDGPIMVPDAKDPVKYVPFVTRNGESAFSLKAILGEFEREELEQLRTYAVARHVLDKGIQEPGNLANRLLNADNAIETGIARADAELAWNSAPEKFKVGVQRLNDLNDALLEYSLRRGFTSPENAAKWRELYSAFVPLERVFQNETTPGLFRGLKGSERMIADPLTTMVERIRNGINAFEKNYFWNELAGQARANPKAYEGIMDAISSDPNADKVLGDLADKFMLVAAKEGVVVTKGQAIEMVNMLDSRPMDKTNNTMIIYKDGVPETWRVSEELKRVQQSMSTQERHVVAKLFGHLENPLRAGVSVGLDVTGIGPLMDQWDAAIQSKYGYKFGYDWFRGMSEIMKKGAMYQERMAAGGGIGGRFSDVNDAFSKYQLNSITKQTAGDKIKSVAMSPMQAMKELMAPINDATRMGAYIRAREAGQNAAVAALESRRVVGGDWGQIGASMAGMNHAVAFMNVGIQANRGLVRTAIENPKKAAMIGLAFITMPELYFWAASQFDDEVKELRRGQGGWNFWYQRIYSTGQIVKVPKPRLLGQLFGSTLGYALDKLVDDDPQAAKNLGDALRQHAAVNFIPTSLMTAASVAFNADGVTGRPIIPGVQQQVEDQYQQLDNTTDFAKQVSQTVASSTGIQISPITMDYIAKRYAGDLGRVGYAAARQLGDTENSPPENRFFDLPLINRWVARHPTSSAGSIREFFDFYNAVGEKFKTAKALEKSPRVELYIDYMDKHAPAYGAAPAVMEAKKQIDAVYQNIHTINQLPDDIVDAKGKRDYTDDLMSQVVDIARAYNESFREVRDEILDSKPGKVK